jgi:uncharacterized protein
MKIGVISDTHDQIHHIKELIARLNDEGVERVVHCGDWVSPFVLHYFKELKAPLYGVFGNNDGDRFRHVTLSDHFGVEPILEERFMEFRVDGRSIALFHGDYPQLVDALVTCGRYDAVFHGHTHLRVNEQVGKTLSLNPGSLMDETLPTVRGASFALYETTTNRATHIHLGEPA